MTTEEVRYKYRLTIYGDIPAGGITIDYYGLAEIEFFDHNGEEEKEIKILSVEVFVNGMKDPFAYLPEEKDAPFFYAKAREAAREAYRQKRMAWQ